MLIGESPLPPVIFILLWLLWAALLFGGFLLGSANTSQRMPRWTRLASSAVLVMTAWGWVIMARGGSAHAFITWLAIGMSFDFLGDLFMGGVLPGGRNVLGGMVTFGLGHIAYIVGIWRYASQLGPMNEAARWASLLVWWIISTVGWYFVVYRGQRPTTLHRAALPYALLLATTAGMAMALALQVGQFTWLAIGAALFLLSDLILAAQLFNESSFPLIGDVIWLTYGPGQMLIVFSAATTLYGRLFPPIF